MKKLLIICFLIACAFGSKAQDIIASTLKIGPFSIDMKLSEVEAITLKKIDEATLRKSINDYKPISVKINDVKFELTFFEEYDEKRENSGKFKLYRVVCADGKVKTRSGIMHGMDKMDVLKLVIKMNVAFNFSRYFEYDDKGKPTKKFVENLSISDSEAGKTLHINFKDGKVSSFEIGYEEGC